MGLHKDIILITCIELKKGIWGTRVPRIPFLYTHKVGSITIHPPIINLK